jgi:predicted phage-related endonuclease
MNRVSVEIKDRESWLAMRARDLTASRIAALFDAHPFMSRQQLAAQLRGGARRIDSFAMRAGRILEPGVAVALCEARPEWRLVKATSYHRIPEQRIGGTPDYFIGEDACVEVTTISPAEWREQPPLYKVLQTHCQMLVTGRRHAWIAIMIRQLPELPLHLFELPHDPVVEEAILDAAADWWRAWDDGGAIAAAAKLEIIPGGWDRAAQGWKPPPAPEPRTQMADIAAMFCLAAQKGWCR